MPRAFDLGSSFGIMQGRLSTQTEQGYQAFPWETWRAEFGLAAIRGLEHIEWVLDTWRVGDNPILNDTQAVIECISGTGVGVVTVCADYLMDRPLDVGDSESWTVLENVIPAMQELGATWLVVPCVDHSSLRTLESLERFTRASSALAHALEGTGIRVSLEADLGPSEFNSLLAKLDPEIFGVNYDIGNSAHLGYSDAEEFDAYGDRISLVHIKDRVFEGGSVPLGRGHANIPQVLDRLRGMEFSGPVTLQVFRDKQGLDVLDDQLRWLKPLISGCE